MASEVNADAKLQTLPGNKSFTMNVNLISDDFRLSPVIDLQRSNAIFTSNRVNNPIENFATDPRVNSMTEDPNAILVYYKRNAVGKSSNITQKFYLMQTSLHIQM